MAREALEFNGERGRRRVKESLIIEVGSEPEKSYF